MSEERRIIRIEQASKGLQIIMRGAEVTMAWLYPDGSATFNNEEGTFRVTKDQIESADELAETGVPPLRHELEPELIAKPEKRRRRRG